MIMSKIVSMNKWFKSWFKSKRILHVNTRFVKFEIIKHRFIINFDFWKWKYIVVFDDNLNVNWWSFIKLKIFFDLLSVRVWIFFHDEWCMLKFFINMYSSMFFWMRIFNVFFTAINVGFDWMSDSLYTLWTCK